MHAPTLLRLALALALVLCLSAAELAHAAPRLGDTADYTTPDGAEAGIRVDALIDPFTRHEPAAAPEPGWRFVLVVLTIENHSPVAIEFDPAAVLLEGTGGVLGAPADVAPAPDAAVPPPLPAALDAGVSVTGSLVIPLMSDSEPVRVLFRPRPDRLLVLADVARSAQGTDERGAFLPAAALALARSGHSATGLADGRIVVLGGEGETGVLADAELWDPAVSGFVPAGPLGQARAFHTATFLPDGRVLVVGGEDDGGALADAEVWDPGDGVARHAGSLAEARSRHTATLLPDGRVLVVGGESDEDTLAAAELWDPVSSTFSAAGTLTDPRTRHTATLLRDGRVLVAGGSSDEGWLDSAESWDPARAAWAAEGVLAAERADHTATLLADGRVLLVGGEGEAAAEVWDPALAESTPARVLAPDRGFHTATPLSDGRVLIVGGWGSEDGDLASAELWDPGSSGSLAAGSLLEARAFHTATVLGDGRVLVVGGEGADRAPIASSELWMPALPEPVPWPTSAPTTPMPLGSPGPVPIVTPVMPTPGLVAVPELIGATEAQALGLLVGAGLLAGARSEVYHQGAPKGTVVAQQPPPGASVSAGGAVTYTLSAGPEPVVVPDVRGLREAEARRVLSGAGLVILERVTRTSRAVSAGTALRTAPRAGSRVERGSGVTLVVAQRPDPTPAPTARPAPPPAATPRGDAARTRQEESLLGRLRARFRGCSAFRERGAYDPFSYGATAAAQCDVGSGGIAQVAVFRFPDGLSLDDYWRYRMSTIRPRLRQSDWACELGERGIQRWEHGSIACYVSRTQGVAHLRWTDERTDTYWLVQATHRDLPRLVQWWWEDRPR
jgi:hypothetical protein